MKLLIGIALGVLVTLLYQRGLPAASFDSAGVNVPVLAVSSSGVSAKFAIVVGLVLSLAIMITLTIVSEGGFSDGELGTAVTWFVLLWMIISVATWYVFGG